MAGSSATLAFLGDLMLGRRVGELLERHPPEWCWGSTLPVLQSCDGVIANLECVITSHIKPWSHGFKVFHFRAPPAAVEVLKAGNVRCLSLANNHVLDFEVAGLAETLALLDGAGIRHAGAGMDAAAAAAPAQLEIAGIRIGIIAVTDNEPRFAAAAGVPGTCYASLRPHSPAYQRIVAAAAELRRQGAQFVVLTAHWGPNMSTEPSREFQAFARGLVADGIDLFHGHSAHLVQAVEVVDGRLILYDTGDFIDDYAVDPLLHNDWSFIFLVELDHAGLRRLRLLPVELGYARTELAAAKTADAICARMSALCEAFETPLRRTAEGLEVPLGLELSQSA